MVSTDSGVSPLLLRSLKQLHRNISVLLFPANVGEQLMLPSKPSPSVWHAMLIILVSPELTLKKKTLESLVQNMTAGSHDR